MMKKKLNIIRQMCVLAMAICLTACNNQWDDHVAVEVSTLNQNLMDAIKADKDLSAFCLLLQETGYDRVLQGEYEYTILAPDNKAIAAFTASLPEGEWGEREKLLIVRNHIAFSSCNLESLSKSGSRLKMVNGKNMLLGDLNFNAARSEVLCNNGMLHVVDKVVKPLMNIDEYLQNYQSLYPDEYEQLDSLYAKTTRVMDTQRSIQKGVNEKGQPVYDTVWTTRNYFFEELPLNDEDSLYTFVLLRNANFQDLKSKYAKYMAQGTAEQTDSLVTDELIRDLVFGYGQTTALTGVKVDFPATMQVVAEYRASNGLVRVLNGVDIPMKENKVKTVVVEAENYLNAYSPTKVYTRLRNWASGGKDIMVSSKSTQVDPVTKNTYSFVFNKDYSSSTYNTDMNFYLQYEVRLNSVIYDVYWCSYDDMATHVKTDATSDASTLVVCQKLFASMPGSQSLVRGSTGAIQNNYWGDTFAFAAYTVAGEEKYKNESVQLRKYALGSLPRMIPSTPVEGEGAFDFNVPRMGNVQLMVCNTAGYHPYSQANQSGGMMFLDYIKFVPRMTDGE